MPLTKKELYDETLPIIRELESEAELLNRKFPDHMAKIKPQIDSLFNEYHRKRGFHYIERFDEGIKKEQLDQASIVPAPSAETITPELPIDTTKQFIQSSEVEETPQKVTQGITSERDIGDPWKRGIKQMIDMGANMLKFYQNLIPTPKKPYDVGPEDWERIKEMQTKPINEVAEKIYNYSGKIKARESNLPEPESIWDYADPARMYQTIAENGPQMAGFMAATLINPYVGFLTMTAAEGGDAVKAIEDYEKETGNKVPEEYKRFMPSMVGALNGALELVGIDKILKVGKVAGVKKKILEGLIASQVEGFTESLQEVNQIMVESGYREIKPEEWRRVIESYYAGTLLGMSGSTVMMPFGKKKGGRYAEGLREDKGLPDIDREIEQAGEEVSREDMELEAPGEPGPQRLREEEQVEKVKEEKYTEADEILTNKLNKAKNLEEQLNVLSEIPKEESWKYTKENGKHIIDPTYEFSDDQFGPEKIAEQYHINFIQKALDEGKNVPEKVINSYPEGTFKVREPKKIGEMSPPGLRKEGEIEPKTEKTTKVSTEEKEAEIEPEKAVEKEQLEIPEMIEGQRPGDRLYKATLDLEKRAAFVEERGDQAQADVLREKAQKIRDLVSKISSGEDLKQLFKSEFKLSEEQAEAVKQISEARAEKWATDNNKTKKEWYQTRIADIKRAEEFERDLNQKALFQGKIEREFYQGTKGATQFLDDGRAIINAFRNADITTGLHELAHVFRRDLNTTDQKTVLDWSGQKEWNKESEEKFARGFERYLSTGKAPTAKLTEVFEKFKEWIKAIYGKITGSQIDLNISAKVKDVYDRILGGEVKETVAKKIAKPKTVRQWAQNKGRINQEHLREHGITAKEDKGLFAQLAAKKGTGIGLDELAEEAISEGVVPKPPHDINPTDWLIEKLRDNEKFGEEISEGEQIQKKINEYYEQAHKQGAIPNDMDFQQFTGIVDMIEEDMDEEDILYQTEKPTKYEKEFIKQKAKEGVDIRKTETMQTKLEKREKLKEKQKTEEEKGQLDVFTYTEKKKQNTLFQEGIKYNLLQQILYQDSEETLNDNQLKRLYTIAGKHKVGREGVRRIYGEFGYKSAKDIKLKDYIKIVNEINKAHLDQLKMFDKDKTRKMVEEGLTPEELQNRSLDELADMPNRKKVNPGIYRKQGEIIQKEKVKDTRFANKKLMSDALTPIRSRILRKSESIARRLRDFEFHNAKQTLIDREGLVPLLEKIKKMSGTDQYNFDLAQKNGDLDKLNELVSKYKIEEEYQQARNILNNIYNRAKEVEFDVGYKIGYFPRMIKDVQGFLNYFYETDAWGYISETIKAREEEKGTMSDLEKAQLINTMIRGYGEKVTLSEPGAFKERMIETIIPEINKFYFDTIPSLLMYVDMVNTEIESRRFFGKGETLDQSIGNFVRQAIENKELSPADENEILGLLRARFLFRATTGMMAAFKNIGYITTMGNVSSAITQFGDLTWAFYNAGPLKTAKAFTRSLFNRSKISTKDIGIDRIAEEFSNTSKLHGALDKVFTYTGLKKIDRIGKEALMNATVEKIRKQVMKGKLSKRYKERLKQYFGEETDQLIQDLRENKITDNVKLLAFNTLLDFQPVALSEMPKKYLDAPNGRVLYMLKTFTIKQFDAFRREGIDDIINGNFKQKAAGMRRLTYLAGLFVLCNAGADELKDLMFGRKTSLSDLTIDNLLRLFGLSRYFTWYMRRNTLTDGLIRLIVPPAPIIEMPARDIGDKTFQKLITGDKKAWEDFKIKDLQTWKIIPFFGKHYYWWFGKGKEINFKYNLDSVEKAEYVLSQDEFDIKKAKTALNSLVKERKEILETRQKAKRPRYEEEREKKILELGHKLEIKLINSQ